MTRPSVRIECAAERERASLQSSLLLIYCGAAATLALAFFSGAAYFPSTIWRGSMLSLLAPFVAYGVSRTRYFRWAWVALSGGPALMILWAVTWVPETRMVQGVLPWLGSALLIPSLILPVRWTIAVALGLGAIFPALAWLAPPVRGVLSSTSIFYVNIALLSVWSAWLRERADQRTREALEDLKNSERFNRAVLSAIPDTLFSLDAEGRILARHGSGQLYGGPAASASIRMIQDIFPENVLPALEKALESLRHGGEIQSLRYFRAQADGLRLHFEARLVPEGHQRVLVMIRDRTEEVRREELIKVQQSGLLASSKMSALGQMAAGIAHEINSPLVIIDGHARYLEDLVKDGQLTESEVLSAAQKVLKTSERIARIVRGLRAFARDGQGDRFELTTVKEILEGTLAICESGLRGQWIRVEVEWPPEGLAIECRSTQISQVLLNLLGNASDAIRPMPDKWIRISAQDAGAHVELSVTDCGSGIPPQIREKLMQPFFTTKDPGKGTGLGLSISKNLVESHGGKLSLDASAANTRFVIRLPKRQAAAAA